MRALVIDEVNFDNQGLVPCVVQNHDNGRVLMLGFMNTESIRLTQKNQKVTFFSRSRGQLWEKGETSGNTLEVIDLSLDCDGDTILAIVRAKGPTCHNGTESCFEDA